MLYIINRENIKYGKHQILIMVTGFWLLVTGNRPEAKGEKPAAKTSISRIKINPFFLLTYRA